MLKFSSVLSASRAMRRDALLPLLKDIQTCFRDILYVLKAKEANDTTTDTTTCHVVTINGHAIANKIPTIT